MGARLYKDNSLSWGIVFETMDYTGTARQGLHDWLASQLGHHNLAAGPTEVISLYSSLERLAISPRFVRPGGAYDVKKSA